MENLIKCELKKSIQNRFMITSLFIGVLAALLSLLYNVTWYYSDHERYLQILANYDQPYNPCIYGYTVFNCWIGGEPFSLGSTIFFFIFPLLIALPYGWSYCEEKNTGYTRTIVAQFGKTPYFVSKYLAVFISGGFAMVFPMIISFLLTLCFIPAITPISSYVTSYGVLGGSLMSVLYYTKPFLYVFFYLCIDFVYCGLLACISLSISSFVKQKWIVVICPFFYCIATNFACRFIYTKPEYIYPELSPFYFLRPVNSRFSATWAVIIGSGLVLLLITITISILWEKKNEIY